MTYLDIRIHNTVQDISALETLDVSSSPFSFNDLTLKALSNRHFY